MSNAIKKASTSAPVHALDECQRAEAATRSHLESATARLSELQARYDNPEPGDTPELLARIERDIADAKRTRHLANAHHERAVVDRAAAKAELARLEDQRRRASLEQRREELAASMPAAYARLAEQLLALVAEVHQLDTEIAEYNKARPAGIDFLSTFEQRVRWTPASAHRRAICPTRLSSIFEIPALRYGDADYRVSRTAKPGDVWIDVNGHPRR